MSAIRKLIGIRRDGGEYLAEHSAFDLAQECFADADAAEAELKELEDQRLNDNHVIAELSAQLAERERADAELLEALKALDVPFFFADGSLDDRRLRVIQAAKCWAAAKGSGRVQTPKVVSCLCSGGRSNGCTVHAKGGGK